MAYSLSASQCVGEPASAVPITPTTAIVTIDRTGIIQSVDNGVCKLFNYNMHELPGRNVKVLIPTPYCEQHDAYLQHYLTTGKKRIIGRSRIVEGKKKDGSIFPIRLSVSEVPLGSNTLFLGMIEPVDRSGLSLVCNGVGKIISIAGKIEELFGYTLEEVSGQNIKVLLPPTGIAKEAYLALFWSNDSSTSIVGNVRNVEAKHKNGFVFPVSLMVNRLAGAPINPEHVESEMFTVSVEAVDDTLEAVFTLNEQGIICSCNRTFTQSLFGYEDSELLGKPISELVPSLITVTPTYQAPDTVDSKDEQKEKGDSSSSYGSSSSFRSSSWISSTETHDTPRSNMKRKRDGYDLPFKRPKHIISLRGERDGTRITEVRHKDGSLLPVLVHLERFTTSEGSERIAGRIKRLKNTESEIEVVNPSKIDVNGPFAAADKAGSNSGNSNSRPILACSSTTSVDDLPEYEIIGTLGKGSYGKVQLARHVQNGREIAVKVLQKDLMDEAELGRARREIAIMQKLKHPNICELYQVVETDDRMYLLMEVGIGGELFTYVSRKGKLDEAEAKEFFAQIVSAIMYCHQRNVIHRDIKHKNILLGKQKSIKLIDFGLSNFTVEGGLRSTFCGTPAYSAPEMILAQKYVGPEIDVWSMGVVLYSMLVGQFPFKTVNAIISGKFTDAENASNEATDLIRRMLKTDPKKRITAIQIAQHPWLKGMIDLTSEVPSSPLVHAEPGDNEEEETGLTM